MSSPTVSGSRPASASRGGMLSKLRKYPWPASTASTPSQIARPTPTCARRQTRIAASTSTWAMKTRSTASVTRAIVPRASRCPGWHHGRMPAIPPGVADAPRAPFVTLSELWLVLTGTLCNLRCTHCLNASGPDEPWLAPLDGAVARRALTEAEALGVREVYFTGGEPFLHREILPLLETSLAMAATTVLTNGTVMTDALAGALAALAGASRYSLEIRVSLDAAEAEANDRVRGRGTWERALRTLRTLDARGLLPIVTATEIADGAGAYDRFRALLRGLGI